MRRNGKVFVTGNSGFPKSMDISKAIDKKRDDLEPVRIICRYLRAAMDMKGIKSRDLAPDFNCHSRLVDHWAARDTDSQPTLPKWEQWLRLKELLDLPDDMDAEVWRLNGRKGTPGEAWEQREVIGQVEEWTDRTNYAMTSRDGLLRSKEGATAAAREWSGWGTALKPAIEPIILARKPLVGTVAQNVLEHGVGGLNIDACRVSGEGLKASDYDDTRRTSPKYSGILNGGKEGEYRGGAGEVPSGRFPANVLLDEHAAKEMDKQSGVLKTGAHKAHHKRSTTGGNGLTHGDMRGVTGPLNDSNEGGASRFFPVFRYQAKAPKRERPVIERNVLRLRDDLTPEQVDHVRERLQEAGIEIE